MSDTLITIIAIFLATVLMFVFPLMAVTERNDDISQTVVQAQVSEFVNRISVYGAIRTNDYEAFIQKLASTGNSYDVEIEVQHLDENPGKKSVITSHPLVGENIRYSTFTTEILDNMYPKTGDSPSHYFLKKGDNVIITVKNTNKTMAQMLRTFFYKITGKGTYQVAASASSLVINDGPR